MKSLTDFLIKSASAITQCPPLGATAVFVPWRSLEGTVLPTVSSLRMPSSIGQRVALCWQKKLYFAPMNLLKE